ncbi:collagen alpha-1(I) chain-like [Ochotona princeps]|uniref:collagen alpha-1(I) chain-like n=1 Tax=Ochotona princeps TaxID=9978 RepID=UPI0027145622|nr:collagen alpha-1(I) chain-like [Ochotona princeps]
MEVLIPLAITNDGFDLVAGGGRRPAEGQSPHLSPGPEGGGGRRGSVPDYHPPGEGAGSLYPSCSWPSTRFTAAAAGDPKRLSPAARGPRVSSAASRSLGSGPRSREGGDRGRGRAPARLPPPGPGARGARSPRRRAGTPCAARRARTRRFGGRKDATGGLLRPRPALSPARAPGAPLAAGLQPPSRSPEGRARLAGVRELSTSPSPPLPPAAGPP